MKIKLPGKLLAALVKAAVGVAEPTDERQILRNLLLTATPDSLEITATDTITGIWLNVPASEAVVIHKAGQSAVSAQNLQRAIKTVANKDVVLKATDRSFTLEADGSKFRLAVEDANDFPRIARFSQRKPFVTVKADLFAKLIDRSAYCAHDEASFQLMHGLLVHVANKEIRMVATNGQRLAVATLPFEQQSKPDHEFDDSVVIPAAAAEALKRIIDSSTPTVDIQWMTNFLNVRTSMGEVSVRCLAGNFPHYERGIPTGLGHMLLDRKSLIDVLKQTTAIKSATSIFVSLGLTEDRMTFSSFAEGAGEAEVVYEFNRAGLDDEKLTINPDFMLDTLKIIRGEDVRFETGNEMTPTILREVDDADGLKSFCVYAVVRQ